MKAIRTFSITSSHDSRERVVISLYKEGSELVWRAGGPLGDEVEELHGAASIKEAVEMAKRGFSPKHFDAKASWF